MYINIKLMNILSLISNIKQLLLLYRISCIYYTIYISAFCMHKGIVYV